MEILALSSLFLRLLTVMIGMIDFGITVDSYLHHYKAEEFFLAVVTICIFLSIFFLIVIFAATSGFLKRSSLIQAFDFIYHIIATLFVFIGAILFLVSVKNFGAGKTPIQMSYYSQRIASGVLGIINALIYFSICVTIYCFDKPLRFIIKKQNQQAQQEGEIY